MDEKLNTNVISAPAYFELDKTGYPKIPSINISQKIFKGSAIQPSNGLFYTLNEDGWTPKDIGTWDAVSRIATLSVQGNETIIINTDNVNLRGLQDSSNPYIIDGSINSLFFGIIIEGRKNITITDFEIINCPIGISIIESENVTIKNNLIKDSSIYGIYIDKSTCVYIEENTLQNCIGASIYIRTLNKHLTISENKMSIIKFGIYVLNTNNSINIFKNTITMGTVLDYSHCGIYFDYINTSIKICENTIDLSHTTNSPNHSDFYIEAIYCYYCNNLEISLNNINISNNASSNNDSYLYNNFIGISIYNATGEILTITYNNIFISNNTMTLDTESYNYFYCQGIILGETSIPVTFSHNNINIISNSLSIIDSSIYDSYFNLRGCSIYSCSNIENCSHNSIKVEKNSSTNQSILYNNYIHGFELYENSNSKFSSNSISLKYNNLPSDSYYFGIHLTNFNYCCTVINNTVLLENNIGYRYYSFSLGDRNTFNKIICNDFSDSQGVSIYLNDLNMNNTIISNLLKNSLYGIYFNGFNKNNLIKKNTIVNNSNIGVYFREDSIENLITQNSISDNTKGLVLSDLTKANIIECNNFINSTGNNAFNEGTNNVFSSNYWSDFNGTIPYDVNGAVDNNPRKYPYKF